MRGDKRAQIIRRAMLAEYDAAMAAGGRCTPQPKRLAWRHRLMSWTHIAHRGRREALDAPTGED